MSDPNAFWDKYDPLTNHINSFWHELSRVLVNINSGTIDKMLVVLRGVRASHGRLFIIGVGGGAANASHAVNDFRKLCNIEAYAPTDNVAEYSARANDEGVETTFAAWLAVSHIRHGDALLVFSVGGGTEEVSKNITNAVVYASSLGASVLGVVGSKIGTTAKLGDVVLVVETDPRIKTPITETVQIAVLHCLVSHRQLQQKPTKW